MPPRRELGSEEGLFAREMANLLLVDQGLAEALVDKALGVDVDVERVPAEAFAILIQTVEYLDQDRMGLAYLDHLPTYVPLEVAQGFLGLDKAELEDLIDQGVIKAAVVNELEDRYLLELSLVLAETTQDWAEANKAALFGGMLALEVLGRGRAPTPNDRRCLAKILGGNVVLATEGVRREARKRWGILVPGSPRPKVARKPRPMKSPHSGKRRRRARSPASDDVAQVANSPVSAACPPGEGGDHDDP